MGCERDVTTLNDDEALLFQMELIKEEYRELMIELNETRWQRHLKGGVTNEQKAKLLKETADLIWVLIDMTIRFNLPLVKAFEMVAHSNMTKINPETGKAYEKHPETGKVMKGPHYWKPELEGIF
jgi:predicted HAD superfamily Cof-like phosphohydrolase